VEAILEGKLDEADLTPAERALMTYVELITNNAPRSTHADVQKLRTRAGAKIKSPKRSISLPCLRFSIASPTPSASRRRII
jgi:hypothetical protein